MSKRPFCVKGGEIIGNVPTIEELAFYIKEYILNEGYSSEWATDEVKGASRKVIYDMHQTVVGQLEYKGLWDASSGNYPNDPELGWYYVVSVAGRVGGVQYYVGDWIIWNGTGWDKLKGQTTVDAVGIQKNYFGVGIKGDINSRDYEISVANGDDFDMEGWFVANGQSSTPNCMMKFTRSTSSSGGLGGSDDAVVVEHNHGASQVEHSHTLKRITVQVGVDGPNVDHIRIDGAGTAGYIDNAQPAITVNNEGVSGVGANKPSYINSIPIIRMS